MVGRDVIVAGGDAVMADEDNSHHNRGITNSQREQSQITGARIREAAGSVLLRVARARTDAARSPARGRCSVPVGEDFLELRGHGGVAMLLRLRHATLVGLACLVVPPELP